MQEMEQFVQLQILQINLFRLMIHDKPTNVKDQGL